GSQEPEKEIVTNNLFMVENSQTFAVFVVRYLQSNLAKRFCYPKYQNRKYPITKDPAKIFTNTETFADSVDYKEVGNIRVHDAILN
ncbi:hypothetical protein CISIN_1g048278mg, partial [Citrus sinensis]